MAYEAIRKAYASTEQSPFVPHTPLRQDLWTGVLTLLWSIERERPVVIGAGWYGLRPAAPPPPPRPDRRRPAPGAPRPAARPEVAAEIVRRGHEAMPVLPGSSLKGAVRQVYELLTPSCGLERGRACRVRPRDARPSICPACSLFGAAGLGGRLAFGEAEPVAAQWRHLVLHPGVPIAWPPHKGQAGTIKFYDQQKALGPDGRAAKEPELTGAVWGLFRSQVRLTNAKEEELGLLLASMGLGATAAPMLRVGGKKFHGFGGVNVALEGATWRYGPGRKEAAVLGERGKVSPALQDWARKLVGTWVGCDSERKRAWLELHTLLARTHGGGSHA